MAFSLQPALSRPMTIGQLAALTNLKPCAIRFYERTGLLPYPRAKTAAASTPPTPPTA
jgi:MerR family regulatory protein